jgi:glycosyltransferase involved in cell wall biosynthesis
MGFHKVSVLIPVHNCEAFIEDAIISVLEQTWQNIEIIIVDDGSTDNSLQIARKYESEKIKIFSQPHSGAPRARNLAFEKSTGEFIQYLDADDLLAKNKIEEQIKMFEKYGKENLMFCSHSTDLNDFYRGGYIQQAVNRNYEKPIELFIDIFKGYGNVMITSWLFTREMILNSDPWDERLIKAQDGEFLIKIALKCRAIFFSNGTSVFYRLIASGRITTNQTPKAIESVILSTESIENSILKFESSERTRKALSILYSSVFCSYYNKRNSLQLKRVEADIKKLGGELMYNGNRYFGLLSKILGIKKTLLLKNFLKRFKRCRLLIRHI